VNDHHYNELTHFDHLKEPLNEYTTFGEFMTDKSFGELIYSLEMVPMPKYYYD
jgi:DNA-binding MltR family transcriptional regulator